MASIASIINWQDNAEADSYGVAIVTLANRTDISTLQDIAGKIVSCPLCHCCLFIWELSVEHLAACLFQTLLYSHSEICILCLDILFLVTLSTITGSCNATC